jgi:hypothetical protein
VYVEVNMAHPSCRVGWCFVWLALALALGCSHQPKYPVTGKVTLRGKPLPHALVSFVPEDSKVLPAMSRTDAEGRYQLEQGAGPPGVFPGRYVVHITTFVGANPYEDPPVRGQDEKVPKEYNVDSTLVRQVQPENNVLDFPLPLPH